MKNIPEQKIARDTPKNKRKTMWKICLILFLALAGTGIYGYFWYQGNNALLMKAQDATGRANKYDEMRTKIIDERRRCENFIAQKEGDFGSFEYCKKFIQWTNETIEPEAKN